MYIRLFLLISSTFRSGEVCAKRWLLIVKGPDSYSYRFGFSCWASWWTILWTQWKWIEPTDWQKCRDSPTTDIARRARASFNMGTDAYFHKETILCQLERLFQLIQFKENYQNHQIEVPVDKGRTHTDKQHCQKSSYSLSSTLCWWSCFTKLLLQRRNK